MPTGLVQGVPVQLLPSLDFPSILHLLVFRAGALPCPPRAEQGMVGKCGSPGPWHPKGPCRSSSVSPGWPLTSFLA